MKKVHVTYPIPSPGLSILRERLDVNLREDESAPTQAELVAAAQGCEGLLTLVRDRVTDDVLEDLPMLRVVANYGVGYDNIDVAAATRRGVLVTNTPDVLTEATADLAFALILAVARRLGEGERLVRAGGFGGWDPRMLIGADVHGATIGLVGMGRIAQAVARRAAGFSMTVLYHSRTEVAEAVAAGWQRVELEHLLTRADFVSVHVPLGPETRHLLDARRLRLMKSSAYLINTARGPVVDEAALVTGLREGWLAGAGLDVYEREPELAEGLAGLDNVVLLPHLGSATLGARSEMARVAATNLVRALGGHLPPNPVNPEALEMRE
ncbi:MAG: 2-hydroxyacid dehydrogenase [Candidatus Dormibacteria bacterium]